MIHPNTGPPGCHPAKRAKIFEKSANQENLASGVPARPGGTPAGGRPIPQAQSAALARREPHFPRAPARPPPARLPEIVKNIPPAIHCPTVGTACHSRAKPRSARRPDGFGGVSKFQIRLQKVHIVRNRNRDRVETAIHPLMNPATRPNGSFLPLGPSRHQPAAGLLSSVS
jgi:hypothetical protein